MGQVAVNISMRRSVVKAHYELTPEPRIKRCAAVPVTVVKGKEKAPRLQGLGDWDAWIMQLPARYRSKCYFSCMGLWSILCFRCLQMSPISIQ